MKFCPHCRQRIVGPREIAEPISGIYFAIFDDLLKVGQSADVWKRLVAQRSVKKFEYFELLGVIPCCDIWPLRILEARVLERMRPFVVLFKSEFRSEWHELTQASLYAAGEILADFNDRGAEYRKSHADLMRAKGLAS